MRSVALSTLALLVALPAWAACPDEDAYFSARALAVARAAYGRDAWPGAVGDLIPGYAFRPDAHAALAGSSTISVTRTARCNELGALAEVRTDLDGPAGAVAVAVVVGQDGRAAAREHLVRLAVGSSGELPPELPGLGDFAVAEVTEEGSSVAFVRANVVFAADHLPASPGDEVDLLELAREVDAELLAAPTFPSLAASGLLPEVRAFALDLRPGERPARGVEAPLVLDLHDPAGEALELSFAVEATDGSPAAGTVNRTPGGFALRPHRATRQSVTVTAIDESGRIGTGSLVTDVDRQDGLPVADAGRSRATLECTGLAGTEIVLDGSASFDPDGVLARHEWTATGAGTTIADPLAAVTTALVGEGVEQAFTLVVVDDEGNADTDTFALDVVDTTPPELSVTLSVTDVWPPSHELVPVEATVQLSDRCASRVTVELVGVFSDEPACRGAGRAEPDVVGAVPGTDDREFSVRAERCGTGDGRTYTAVYRAVDRRGNAALAEASLVVRHDRRR